MNHVTVFLFTNMVPPLSSSVVFDSVKLPKMSNVFQMFQATRWAHIFIFTHFDISLHFLDRLENVVGVQGTTFSQLTSYLTDCL